MKLSDLFRFSTDNLRRRKGRTVLTVIGVVVGVCAIVVMISLGIAVNQATEAMLQSWGDLTKITVYRYGAQQGTPDLDDAMIEQFKQIPNVEAATPMYQSYEFSGTIYAGKGNKYEYWNTPVGMDADSLEPMGYELLYGDYLSGNINLGKGKIPVLVEASTIFNFYDAKKSWNSPSKQMYAEYDDMGNVLNYPMYDEMGNLTNADQFFFDIMNTKLTYRVMYDYGTGQGDEKYLEYELVPVGMLKTGASDWPVTSGIVMSIEDLKKIEADYKKATKQNGTSGGGGGMFYYGGGEDGTTMVNGYDNVFVKVNDVKNMPDVEKQIKDLGYQISSMSEVRKDLQGQVAQTQMMLGGLAAVSLFVAALNIANTMTMAIYERTKEIGVMKVLGCKLPNIRQMFLIESGAIGLLGGLIGVAVSVILSFALNYMPLLLAMLGIESSFDIGSFFGLGGLTQAMPGMKVSVIPMWLILLALGFATLVGLLSGIAPANRAVKISSLEAIRHE